MPQSVISFARLLPVAVTVMILAACGSEPLKPPNTFIDGTVQSIKVETRTHKLFGQLWQYYTLDLAVVGSSNWTASVSSDRTSEDAMRGIIGQKVSFSCHREHTSNACYVLQSLKHNGVELMTPIK